MFCFLEESVRLFGSLKSYYEAIEVVDAEFSCISSKLSKDIGIITFLSNFPKRDAVTITISGVSDFELSISNQSIWVDQFQSFLSSHDDDDEITIKIHIDKSTDAENRVSVYCYEKIIDYIEGLSTKKQLNLFAKVFQKNSPYFRFDVFDTNADLFSEYIAFCNTDAKWPTVTKCRESKLKMCEEASAFLNRFELHLIPQDFCLTNQCNNKRLVKIFNRLESILSYIYMANSSHIISDQVYLQFGVNSGFDYKLDSIDVNNNVCDIYKWAFGGDTAVERASIARNIILLHCKTAEQFLEIDESILTSIKSNYLIYQKDNTTQYIDMKNKISAFIVDISKQIQEMTHGMVEGMRNNFFAVVTFIITIVFIEALNVEDLTKAFLSKKVLYISYMFVIASIMYWIVTIMAQNAKWSLISDGYTQLKKNYADVLDSKDIENAFSNDTVFNAAKKRLSKYKIRVSIVWFIFIVLLFIFIEALNPNPLYVDVYNKLNTIIQTLI